MAKIKAGNKFFATVKKGNHSKDLEGNECAGKKIGPFIATVIRTNKVEAGWRHFVYQDWALTRE